MNRNNVINYIINSYPINEAIYKIYYKDKSKIYIDTVDDFKNHFYIQIYEMKEDKLIKAYKEGYLDYLCVRILSNQNKNTSSFFKSYRTGIGWTDNKEMINSEHLNNLNTSEQFEFSTDSKLSAIEEAIKEIYPMRECIGSNDWYHYTLYKLYYYGTEDENGNLSGTLTYKKIEEITNINYLTVRTSVMATTEKIKSIIYDNIDTDM